MRAHQVVAVALPRECGIAAWSDDADLADAFAIELDPVDAAKGVDHLARCVMDDPPLWLRTLLGMRDAFVAVFGIKTSAQLRLRAAAEGAAHIDFFRVHSRSESEVIVGEDDRHLDFRASIMIRDGRNGRAELVATTVVHCHNVLGRTYLAVIAPFHRFIVQANLRRASESKWKLSAPTIAPHA